MHHSIPLYFKSLFLAAVFGLLAEVLLSLLPGLKKYHIPRAFLGGIMALLAGPQVLGLAFDWNLIDADIQGSWNELALFLVNVVFASIFLGRAIPNLKTSMHLAIPQASLGQTLAWGQYLVGGLVTLFILIPVFDLNESVASFIEISFQGGVGVAVGMGETFRSIDLSEAKSITVALAPLAMLVGILSGILLINYRNRRTTVHLEKYDRDEEEKTVPKVNRFQESLIVQIALVGISILFGQLILYGLQFVEDSFLKGVVYSKGFVKYIPFFPLALIGGAVFQLALNRFSQKELTNRKTIKRLQTFSLDALIIMAIGTIDLGVIGENMLLVLIMLVAGTIWNLSCFLLTYKLLIPKYAFERGISDYGQSMGTTSIGLMFQSIVDRDNKSRGREAFAIKQLLFEPFVGGGLVTGLSPLIIQQIGLSYFTLIAFVLTLFFFLIGFFYSKGLRDKE